MFNLDSLFWTNIILFFIMIGITILCYQFKKTRDVKEGQIVISLYESFSKNLKLQQLYYKLEAYQKGDRFALKEEDSDLIQMYLSFFISMNGLFSKNLVHIKRADPVFNVPFFLIMNNPYVQALLIEQDEYYGDLIFLYHRWISYLKKNRLREPFNENSLSIILGRKTTPRI